MMKAMRGNMWLMLVIIWLCLLRPHASSAAESFLYANRTRHAYQQGCVLDNMEIKLSSRITEVDMTLALFKSLKLTLPCFIRIVLIVSHNTKERWEKVIQEQTTFLTTKDREWIVIIEEKLDQVYIDYFNKNKQSGKTISFFLQNYFDFYLDKFTLPTTEYTMVFDADTVVALPINCQSIFDERGLPYWTYWIKGADWGLAMSPIANDPAVRTFLNATDQRKYSRTDDFMTFFPMIVPVKALPTARQALMVHFKVDNEPDAFFNLQKLRFSNFDLLGKFLGLINNPPVITLRRCANASNAEFNLGGHRSCDTGYFAVEHVGHPGQTAVADVRYAKHLAKKSPEYWNYFKHLYERTQCFCLSFPGLCANDTGLLAGIEPVCNAIKEKHLTTAMIPEEIMFYPDRKDERRRILRRRLAQFAIQPQPGRRYCSDPYPTQVDDYMKAIWF